MISTPMTLPRAAHGDQGRGQFSKLTIGLRLMLACLLMSCVGCSQFSGQNSESVVPNYSLGDVMRGLHKPATPDDSLLYPAPPPHAVSSLHESEVVLDGSSPEMRLARDPYDQSDRYVARQYPQNYTPAAAPQTSNYSVAPGVQLSVAAGTQPVARATAPAHITVPNPYQFKAPQGPPLPPGTPYNASQSLPNTPSNYTRNNYLAPSNFQTPATAQPQSAPQVGAFGQAINGNASNQGYSSRQFAQGAPQQFVPNQQLAPNTQFAPAPNFTAPNFTAPAAPQLVPSQTQIIPAPTQFGSGGFVQPQGVPGQAIGPGVDYTPNLTPFGSRQQAAPQGSFVPGSGGAFPPIGTAPVYTPTTRYADLIINGYPARTGRIMFGGAVNSDAGVTGQVTIDERNFDIRRWPTSFRQLFAGQAFRGAGETFRVEAAPGSDFDRYTVQWATPNLFNYLPFSLSVSGFLFDRQFNDWDEQRKGGRVSLGYRVTPDLSVSLGFSGQEVQVSDPSSLLAPELNDVLGDNTLFSGMFSLKHDTRNSPIQASRGHYFEFSFEQAFGDFDYSRFELEYRKYWLLTERIDGSGKQTLSFSTQVGFSGDETPIFENFFAGGYATIRGFDFRGASPRTNGIEVGGRFQWLNTLEYMFPITADDAFRGVAFVDFGTVERDIEIDSDNYRVAPGVGLRMAIPALGPAPLAFDFAFPVAQADGDDERVFSFYMSLVR